MSSKKTEVVTIGSLIKKDLNDCYFLPAFPSSHSPGYRFQNDVKYRVYDCPPPSRTYNTLIYPFGFLCTVGNQVTTLIDHDPPKCLTEHWQTWLPDFPSALLKPVDEGMKDNLPIVTNGPMQCIPAHKHSIDPDVHYKILRKSLIPQIRAPCPKHMSVETASFPCVVKVDMSWCGLGGHVVHNKGELDEVLKEIRGKNGWKDTVVIQELIQGIKEVAGFSFYLQKSGDLIWLGTSCGQFNGQLWTGSVMDWSKQEEYKSLVYDQFTIPIKNLLHNEGYFGLASFEVLITDHGMYLIDVNPRVGGDTALLLLAPYVAEQYGLNYSILRVQNTACQSPTLTIVKNANTINNRSQGKIIVISAADLDVGGCLFDVCVFGKSQDEVEALYYELTA